MINPRIVVFSKEKDYRELAANEVSAAHYVPLMHRDYIAIGPGTGENDLRTTVHEYVHLLVRYSDQITPVWMNEGVAELFSNIQAEGKKIRVGAPISGHVFTLRNAWLPLADVVAAGHESGLYNRRQHVGSFYGMSWALVHMLMLDKRYSGQYSKLVTVVGGGADSASALTEVYGKPLKAIEDDLREYMVGKTVMTAVFDTQFDRIDEKMPGRNGSDYEWGLATGDLMYGARKFQEAAERFEALAIIDPNRPEAYESLAFLQLSQRQESRFASYTKARSLGSKNPRLSYWAPSLSKDRQEAIGALQDLVARYPGYNEAKIRLASQLVAGRQFEEAFETLKSIKKIGRKSASEYFGAFVPAAWMSRQVAESRTAAAQFERISTAGEKELARRLSDLAAREYRTDQPVAVVAAVVHGEAIAAAEELLGAEEFLLPEETGLEIVRDEKGRLQGVRQKPLTVTEGVLVNLACDAQALLTVKTAEGEQKLLIEDAGNVSMAGSSDGKGELTCGAQEKTVKIGFYPKVGLPKGATGSVRSIEFVQ